MEILELYNYLNSHRKYKYTESLESLVETQRASTKTRPLVIIDGLSICNKLFGESYPALFDYAQVHESLSKLSTLLTSLDVDVEVHFPRGSQEHKNFLYNKQRSDQRLLYNMKKKNEPNALRFVYKHTGWSYRDIVKFLFGFYFEVVRTMGNCRKDLLRYAHSHNCLAIITQELTLNAQCWHYELLNYTDKTVTLFNMQRFANTFDFNADHMLFIFASLGNWVLAQGTMTDNYGNRMNFTDRLYRITSALSSFKSLTLYQLRESPHLEAYVDYIFPQADDKISLYQNFARSLTANEECDCTDVIEQDNILRHVKTLVEQNKIQYSFFNILKNQKFYNVYGIQCISNREFQYARVMEVYADLRKRIYYLLFRDVKCIVKEYWAKHLLESCTVEIETKEVNPESVGFEINTSLLELMQNEDDLIISDLKWRILVHTVSSTIDIDQFKYLSPKYYSPVLILHYLLNVTGERIIEKWEADLFLCHLYLRKRVPYVQTYNNRAYELINVYNSGLSFVCYLVAAAGFPISIQTLMESNSYDWHFDGRAFYNAYCYLEHRKRDRAMITDKMSTEPRRLLGLI